MTLVLVLGTFMSTTSKSRGPVSALSSTVQMPQMRRTRTPRSQETTSRSSTVPSTASRNIVLALLDPRMPLFYTGLQCTRKSNRRTRIFQTRTFVSSPVLSLAQTRFVLSAYVPHSIFSNTFGQSFCLVSVCSIAHNMMSHGSDVASHSEYYYATTHT